jgi:hypothetical protein
MPPAPGSESAFPPQAVTRSGWRCISAADDAILGMAFFI